MNQQPSLSIDTLLRHEPFVRAVVRGLLSDEDRVKDVVQQTWLVALRRPPRGVASLRSWLARVAANLARDSHRSAGRRKRREEAVARPEAVESVDVTHGRLAAQREVVDVVLALKEPYRSVVLLRYYQDLSPTAIAERLERSPATIRSQLSRAHEILRSALDTKFEGGRSVWSGLFVPLLREPSPVATIGNVGIAATVKVAVATVGIATVAVMVFPRPGAPTVPTSSRPIAPSGSALAPGSTAPVDGNLVAPAAGAEEDARQAVASVSADPSSARSAPGASVQRRQPPERDLWYGFFDGGQRHGAHRVEVAALPDGNYRYRVSVRVLVDLLASHQEITVQGEYVVTPDLRPVSMKVESGKLLGSTVVVGRTRGDTMVFSSDPADGKSDRAVSMDAAETVLFSISVDDWLARQGPGIESATARVFDDQTWELDTVAATRLRRDVTGSEWRLDYGDGHEEHTVTLDAEGLLLQGLIDGTGQRSVRCTADEARDLVPLDINSPAVLCFPVDRDIDSPQRLDRLVVKLSWEDIPFDEFRLEDGRQRLLDRSVVGDGQSAVVQIVAPAATVDTATIPVEGEALARYLAETAFVKPNDPKILAAATEVVGDTTNALEAATVLSRWVFEYLKPEFIVETLSGPEVLAQARGKCSEYSTLFASMARAVGIPTRIVLGERMVGDSWMGHMWNEAWVGRWITVDASAHEVDGSLMLLKLIHSDSVEGTQRLRWSLTESLSISIEDFQLTEPALAGAYETGINGATYTNVDFVSSLTAPSSDWTLSDRSDHGAVIIGFEPPEAKNVGIHFLTFTVPEGTRPTVFIDTRIEQSRGAMDAFEVLTNEPLELHGTSGHRSQFQGRLKGSEHNVLTTEVCWVRGAVAYLLTLSGRESSHEAWHTDFEKLIDSFRFLDE